MRIVWRFLRAKTDARFNRDVLTVIRDTLMLKNPRWYLGGIQIMVLVEVERDGLNFFAMLRELCFHFSTPLC